jgi:hypothetical protein
MLQASTGLAHMVTLSPLTLIASAVNYSLTVNTFDGTVKLSYSERDQPFNAGIKSLRATLPDESFSWGFCLNRAFR